MTYSTAPGLTFLKFLIAMAPAMLLAACSGSSSGNSSANSQGAGASVSLSTSAASVAAGGSVVLSWSSNGASSCSASGGWSGSRSTSGSQTVGPINQTTTYTLSCSGSNGGAVQQVTVQVGGNGVTVNLSASPAAVAAGNNTTLTWSSSGASSCTASGGWSGSRATSGSFTIGPINASTTYQLSCTGAAGSGLGMTTVQVIDKTLRWQAPAQNVDGSPLTDLAGYVIYWGRNSRTYTDSFTINSPSVTQWEATMAAGDYFFAMTAFDSQNDESGYSNEILKSIPD